MTVNCGLIGANRLGAVAPEGCAGREPAYTVAVILKAVERRAREAQGYNQHLSRLILTDYSERASRVIDLHSREETAYAFRPPGNGHTAGRNFQQEPYVMAAIMDGTKSVPTIEPLRIALALITRSRCPGRRNRSREKTTPIVTERYVHVAERDREPARASG